MPIENARTLYEKYAEAVACVIVIMPDGTESVGSAFHIGEGTFITARHVVEGNRVISIGTMGRRVEMPAGSIITPIRKWI